MGKAHKTPPHALPSTQNPKEPVKVAVGAGVSLGGMSVAVSGRAALVAGGATGGSEQAESKAKLSKMKNCFFMTISIKCL